LTKKNPKILTLETTQTFSLTPHTDTFLFS